MKDLQFSAKSAVEYGVVVLLVVIIIGGSYKLYKNWTSPEPVKTHNPVTNKKLFEKPSKDLCDYVVNQCNAKYNMKQN